MSRCLPEDTLLMLYSGEGSDAERAHLRSCQACEARHARLGDDLQLIDRVLSEAPPQRTSAHRLAPRGLRWMPVAAALAGIVAFVMGVSRLWSPPSVQVAAATASVSVFAEDVSAALFATPEPPMLEMASSNMAHLQAALTGGWPCTGAQLLNGECNDQYDEVLEDD